MTEFKGTYESFYKFFDGYARNKTLALTKKHKSGVCAYCGITNAEIQSAHIRGCERKDIVKEFFNQSIISETGNEYVVDIDRFEELFVNFTQDLSNFHFLCQKCHNKYDKSPDIGETDFLYKAESIKQTPPKK